MDQLNNIIPISIFTASLLGSVHCVGMCGPLYWSIQYKQMSVIPYHLARIVAYTFLGALFGGLGNTLGMIIPLKILQIFSAIIILLYISGSISQAFTKWNWLMLWQSKFAKLLQTFFPQKLFFFISNFSKNMPKSIQAIFIGGASVLLPCSWLYTFLIGAISTGSPLKGAAAMLSFSLGTIPALVLSTYILPIKRYGKYINLVAVLGMIVFLYFRFPEFSLATIKMKCH